MAEIPKFIKFAKKYSAMSIKEKIFKWFWFTFKNPVVRKGEAGGFKWKFRRFWMEVETLSGNFKAKFMADAHPYAVLIGCEREETIHGYCSILYQIGKLLTTDAGFVNDVQKAISKYDKRLQKKAASGVVEDETEEKIALETEKAIQEHIELPSKERKKVERGIDGRFKKAVKKVENEEKNSE